jgi:hypothetical protein
LRLEKAELMMLRNALSICGVLWNCLNFYDSQKCFKTKLCECILMNNVCTVAKDSFGPRRKIVSAPPPPAKRDRLKIFYTKLETLTVSHIATWARSERVNLYNQQTVILLKKIKNTVGPQHPFGSQGPGTLHPLSHSPTSFVGTGLGRTSPWVWHIRWSLRWAAYKT